MLGASSDNFSRSFFLSVALLNRREDLHFSDTALDPGVLDRERKYLEAENQPRVYSKALQGLTKDYP